MNTTLNELAADLVDYAKMLDPEKFECSYNNFCEAFNHMKLILLSKERAKNLLFAIDKITGETNKNLYKLRQVQYKGRMLVKSLEEFLRVYHREHSV